MAVVEIIKRHYDVLSQFEYGVPMTYAEVQAKLNPEVYAGKRIVSALSRLVGKGLLQAERRDGGKGRGGMGGISYIYHRTKVKAVPIEGIFAKNRTEPDPALERAAAIQLTEDQWFYLRGHYMSMSRRQFATRLGLTKLEVNFAIVKLEEMAE